MDRMRMLMSSYYGTEDDGDEVSDDVDGKDFDVQQVRTGDTHGLEELYLNVASYRFAIPFPFPSLTPLLSRHLAIRCPVRGDSSADPPARVAAGRGRQARAW